MENKMSVTSEQYEQMLKCESLESFIGYVKEHQIPIVEAELVEAYQILADRKNGVISDDEAAGASGGGRQYLGNITNDGRRIAIEDRKRGYCGYCRQQRDLKLVGTNMFFDAKWECQTCHGTMYDYGE